MANISIADSIKQRGWGDRRNNQFISTIIMQSNVLSGFTMIDKVKKRAEIPIYDANIIYGDEFCNIGKGGDGSISLGEKTITNREFTWFLSNCQTALYDTYRSMLMKKGSNNEESLDTDLKNWLFDFFAKKNAEKLLLESAEELTALISKDAECVHVTAGADILTTLKNMYKAMPKELLDMLNGDASEEYKPSIYMSTEDARDYTLAVADFNSVLGFISLEKREVPSFLGMNIIVHPALKKGDIIITNPANLLFVTDDAGDVESVSVKWDEMTSTEKFYGKFMIGFNYRRSETIVSTIALSTGLAAGEPLAARASTKISK